MTQNENEPIQLPPGAPDLRLTDWAKEPTIQQLKQDFEDSRSTHDAHSNKVQEWLDHLYIRGMAKIPKSANRSSVQPMLIRKQAEWRYANLSEPFLSAPDMFNVKPVTWEDKKAAEQNSLVLNHQMNNKLDKQRLIDEMVRTAVDEGTVIIKTGWEYRSKMETVPKPIYSLVPTPAGQQEILRIQDLAENSPSEFNDLPEEWKAAYEASMKTGMPHVPQITDYVPVEEEKVLKNQPTIEVCDYRNVVIDPSCGGDFSKAQFVIHMWETNMAELKADGRYSNLEYVDPQNQGVLGLPDYSTSELNARSFNFQDKARRKFIVYEYWGFRDIDDTGETQPFVATWVGDIMIRMERNPFPDQALPFVVIPYLPVRGTVYGESDGSLLIDNQKVVGAISRGLIDSFAKSANSQTGIAKGTLDVINRRKFERGEDYEFNPGTNPQTAIFMHEFPQIPQSAGYMIDSQNQEAESITGVKSFSTGIAGGALGDTATGIRGALDAASRRELGLLRRLSTGMIKIARKIIAMNQQWLNEVEVVRVTNEHFVPVRRDDLMGEFDLDLTISTAEEDNAKAQELAFMLQTLGPNMGWEVTAMIMSDVAKLRKMPDLAEKIERFQPQPDPIQQQIQQLQILKLQAEIETERARAASFGANAQLDLVKQGTEVAKANNLNTAADMNNLNFVEQSTGVTQERNLQSLREQSAAQTAGKIIESQVVRQNEPGQMTKN